MKKPLLFRRRRRVVSSFSEALDDTGDFSLHNLPESVTIGSPDPCRVFSSQWWEVSVVSDSCSYSGSPAPSLDQGLWLTTSCCFIWRPGIASCSDQSVVIPPFHFCSWALLAPSDQSHAFRVEHLEWLLLSSLGADQQTPQLKLLFLDPNMMIKSTLQERMDIYLSLNLNLQNSTYGLLFQHNLNATLATCLQSLQTHLPVKKSLAPSMLLPCK